ncbi:MAG: 4-hydroxythreonine-4-phosphate dehydrogenase PdxA [Polyangiaceae bacterium]
MITVLRGERSMSEKPLAISVGCPCGIGPEIAVKAADSSPLPYWLVGDRTQLLEIAKANQLAIDPERIVQPTRDLAHGDRSPGKPTPASGAAQLAWIDTALDLVTSGSASAIVTGPVSKDVIAHSGAPRSEGFKGHTEYLQERLGAEEVIMSFWSEKLVTSLVTTHLPLSRVPSAITPEKVASAAYWLAWLLGRLNPHKSSPNRVAIAGLNPHAGESGLLGSEEQTVIEPGLQLARARSSRSQLSTIFVGPLGAETAFRLGAAGELDGVVAMYHDQATIPMKLLSFGDAVNVSLGLPVIRTSVDHGTAYDRAGRGTADPSAMRAAMVLAHRLTEHDR